MTKLTASARTTAYDKLRLTVRYWLLGRGYTKALEAMEFAAGYHTGLRKDGNPEFSHQIWQVAYARTMADMMTYPEATIATIFLHDVVEDYPVRISEIDSLFGGEIADPVNRISKLVEFASKSPTVYFGELALCPKASVAKGIDRIHNHQTMRNAFHRQKQISYLGETEDDILPMLKQARRRFPGQEPVYENIKHMLITQMELYAHALEDNAGAA